MIVKEWGAAMKEARERMGLSQEALAERLGVSQTAIYQWEYGQMPKASSWGSIYSAVGVDPAMFRGYSTNRQVVSGGVTGAVVQASGESVVTMGDSQTPLPDGLSQAEAELLQLLRRYGSQAFLEKTIIALRRLKAIQE